MYKGKRILKIDNKVRLWEIALAVGFMVALCSSIWAGATQNDLSDRIMRLHIIANSNSPNDQLLKTQVRDRILVFTDSLTDGVASLSQAEKILREHIDQIQALAQDEIYKRGYVYPVRVELAQTHFPTKHYDGFSLPAGDYMALRILIGASGGENWWCVVFPTLCLPTASPNWRESAQASGLNQELVALMDGQDAGYVIKFQIVEWWDAICSLFKS